MFFDDEDLVLKRKSVIKALPPIPETGWKPPREFPNLSGASVISLDTETKDGELKDKGPGWARGGKGYIAGFSLAARDRLGNRGSWYFPIRHEVEPHDNLDPVQCLNFARSVLHTPHIPKVGAHIIYDVGWFTEEKIFVEGPLYDIQFAEALIDEDARVALEVQAHKYLNEGKTTDLLKSWIIEAYGAKETEWRSDIWRAPPRLAGPYGEQDAALPLRILEKQWPILTQQGLLSVFEMECKLIRLLVRMRIQGVRVDVNKAHRLQAELEVDIARLYAELKLHTGLDVNVNSPEGVAKVFDHVGIKYPRTPLGAPSFRKEWMKNLEHPIAKLVNDIREHIKVKSTFVERYILDKNNNGRLHCEFHPLKDDEFGTGVGRFSSGKPNLQNIPVRTKLGKKVRGVFVPEENHIGWEKRDYSQLQYRGLACYAVDDGDGSAEALRQDYRNDPKTDYHKRIQVKAEAATGREIDRRPIKNINFGLVFGLGKAKLIRMLGFKTQKEGEEFYKMYHEIVPYAKPTLRAIANEVQQFGYITSPLGRRCRFNLWEPAERDFAAEDRPIALPYKQALMEYGANIKRADDYTGIAYKLQAFEADVIKSGMVACYEAGIFEVTGVPLLQVHDELDFSVIDDSPQMQAAFREMSYIMETSVPLPVPLRVDSTRGAEWGSCKD